MACFEIRIFFMEPNINAIFLSDDAFWRMTRNSARRKCCGSIFLGFRFINPCFTAIADTSSVENKAFNFSISHAFFNIENMIKSLEYLVLVMVNSKVLFILSLYKLS